MNAALLSIAPAASAVTSKARADALRVLAMDAVQAANSGHPGMPMGMADIAEVLWQRHLRHDPADPAWPDRDRFVVSNGHGSMLLYALLHLTGYDLPMDELRRFRQLGSRTPGHPETGLTPGVETTTGPLGQGFANAVGMALAERLLAAEFNRPGFTVVDHFTYVFLGDGCLMEGISHEAAALAGTLRLSKLVCLYDDNGISIDSAEGDIRNWFTDDTPRRFAAYGWQVISNVDGHNPEAIDAAIAVARANAAQPTLICCRTVIGKGSPGKAGSGHVHGAPLGEKEVAATREALGWSHPPFEIPADVRQSWDARIRGAQAHARWSERFEGYRRAHPELARELERRWAGQVPADCEQMFRGLLERTQAAAPRIATRKASQEVIEACAPRLPELLGGSADLTGSNLTNWSGTRPVTADTPGNYVHYGVREFGMTAAMNGVALHGGFVPYGGTFLVFSDYARNAVRMAALMRLRSILVFTHDSIGLGEDGPTHQPIEHLAALRVIPNLDVWRPCDAVETVAAWRAAVTRRDGPTALVLSRQALPAQARDDETLYRVERGGYVLVEPSGGVDAVVLATGSEVAVATAAASELAAEGLRVRVVSMPCTSVFDRQPLEYRMAVLPPNLPCVAVEAGVPDGWWKYVGRDGGVVGISRFGESAPAPELFEHFGITAGNVARTLRGLLDARGRAPDPTSKPMRAVH